MGNCKRGARDRSGFCIRHGGGPRCAIDGCSKGAIKKNGYCINHSKERKDDQDTITDEVESITSDKSETDKLKSPPFENHKNMENSNGENDSNATSTGNVCDEELSPKPKSKRERIDVECNTQNEKKTDIKKRKRTQVTTSNVAPAMTTTTTVPTNASIGADSDMLNKLGLLIKEMQDISTLEKNEMILRQLLGMSGKIDSLLISPLSPKLQSPLSTPSVVANASINLNLLPLTQTRNHLLNTIQIPQLPTSITQLPFQTQTQENVQNQFCRFSPNHDLLSSLLAPSIATPQSISSTSCTMSPTNNLLKQQQQLLTDQQLHMKMMNAGTIDKQSIKRLIDSQKEYLSALNEFQRYLEEQSI